MHVPFFVTTYPLLGPCSPFMMCVMVRPLVDCKIRPTNMMPRSKSCVALALWHGMLLLKVLIASVCLGRAFRRDRVLNRLSNPMDNRTMCFVWRSKCVPSGR